MKCSSRRNCDAQAGRVLSLCGCLNEVQFPKELRRPAQYSPAASPSTPSRSASDCAETASRCRRRIRSTASAASPLRRSSVAWFAIFAETICWAMSSRPSALATCWRTRWSPLGESAPCDQPITRPDHEHHTTHRSRQLNSRSRAEETSTFPWITRPSTRSIGTLRRRSPALVTSTRPLLRDTLAPAVAAWRIWASGAEAITRRRAFSYRCSEGRHTETWEHHWQRLSSSGGSGAWGAPIRRRVRATASSARAKSALVRATSTRRRCPVK